MRPLRTILAALLMLPLNAITVAAEETPRQSVHVVRHGETVDSIARRYGIAERDLATWNGLPRPYRVKKGQKLRLAPAEAGAASAGPSNSGAAAVRSAPPTLPPKPSAPAAATPAPVEVKPMGTTEPAEVAAQLPVPVAETAAVDAEPGPTTREERPRTALVPGSRSVVDGPIDEAAQAQRQEMETVRQTTLSLIRLLVETGVLTREKADELMSQAKRDAAEQLAGKAAAETKIIRVPYVPQSVREEIKSEIRREVVAKAKVERWGQPDAVPEWTERIKLSGDIRLRAQSNSFDQNNALAVDVNGTNQGNGLVLANTTENNNLLRYQARLGVDAVITPRVSVGLRITTGTIATPVSFDQTLGNTFNKNSLVIDRAYLQAVPWDWLTLWGGRMPNPWFHTDLVWDPDLSLDGVAAKFDRAIATGLRLFVTGGLHPIEFVDCSTTTQARYCGRDKWLYAGQIGLNQEFGRDVGFTVAAAYYDYRNLAAPFNDPVIDPLNRSNLLKYSQRGNTVYNVVTSGGNPLLGLAADYRLVNLTGSVDYRRWERANVNFTVDYVENVGYDREAIRIRTGGLVNLDPRTRGYQFRLGVGQRDMKEWGDWQVFGAYKYLQRDAVVDAFTDSDFALGGTDAKGYILGGLAGLARNTWVRVRWLSTNAIDGPPRAVDVLQVDLNAKF